MPSPIPFDNSYARLPEAFAVPVMPTAVTDPKLIQLNEGLAVELGIDPDSLTVDILAGNAIPDGSKPVAQAYSGHQFGSFNPQLGDGRAILLGEVVDTTGTRRDVQLKGSGPTPFSRRGDGRSALGPVLREYLVSEAMHALGVPTTRALAAVTSSEKVFRESMQAGGVFTRIASSHIRVGTFQWFACRQDFDNLRILADYAIDRHYPDARQAENPHLGLLEGVMLRQAELVASWTQFGFIHGVMNTDNFSISGETIDYGPCAFLDEYDPAKKFSSIDQNGRYAFANQAPIAQWNLTRFAETLLPFLDDEREKAIAAAEEVLNDFPEKFAAAWSQRLANKIGFAAPRAGDGSMGQALLDIMAKQEADFTLTFRHLADALNGSEQAFFACFVDPSAASAWLDQWQARMKQEDSQAAIRCMRKSNPIFIPRNHRIEEAIAAGYEGEFAAFHRLHDILQKPFTEQPENAEFEKAPASHEIVCATFCGT